MTLTAWKGYYYKSTCSYLIDVYQDIKCASEKHWLPLHVLLIFASLISTN